jgi:acyl carrier protein
VGKGSQVDFEVHDFTMDADMIHAATGMPEVEGVDIRETVENYIVENFLFGDDTRISPDTDFLDNGILDSTGVLELVGFLEEKFGIRIEDDELVPDNMNSLEKITRYISRKINKSQPV